MSIDRTHTRDELLLSVSDVELSLGEGANRRLILRGVNANVHNVKRPGRQQGQTVGFLGPSGIGKTQLFNIIAGFRKPDKGTVLIGPEQVPVKAGMVGVVEQHYRVFEHMTVLQNLVFAGQQGGLSKSESTENAMRYLAKFDLAQQVNSWPARLSGGQRQRLAILQQVMLGHQTICMDEPFSGLDVNQVQKVAKLISELTSENELLTIIVVTHDIGAAIEVSDTLWLMGQEVDPVNPGEFLPGAFITSQADLALEGLAWDPDIRQNPRFMEFEAYVSNTFQSLTKVS